LALTFDEGLKDLCDCFKLFTYNVANEELSFAYRGGMAQKMSFLGFLSVDQTVHSLTFTILTHMKNALCMIKSRTTQ
jgi:hypothetical protein